MKEYLLPQKWLSVSAFIQRWGVYALLLLFPIGFYWSLMLAPVDETQGEVYRLIFIHVPCAFLSLAIYVCMGVLALLYLIWRIKLADMIANAIAQVGFLMTVCALVTGSLWGKPTWGTYWIWDARLTSELITALFYLSYLLLRQKPYNAKKRIMANVIIVLGLVNVPIVHYSVNWWNTLHQGSTLLRANPSISPEMLYPLLWMMFSCALLVVVIGAFRYDQLYRQMRARHV